MGDVDELTEMGKKLNFNPLEQKKYKTHIETIKYNSQKAKAWRIINFFWQFLFFFSVFILAFSSFFDTLAYFDIISESMGKEIVIIIDHWFGFTFSLLIPFSFPLMMWSGVVRSKWDGKLTRSTAYALSFMENIEHRQYLEEKAQVRPLQVRTPKVK